MLGPGGAKLGREEKRARMGLSECISVGGGKGGLVDNGEMGIVAAGRW